RTEPAFRVCLQHEAAKIRNGAIEAVDAGLPERGDSSVEWIERVQSADFHRAAEVDGDRQRDAPRTERVGDSGKLRYELRRDRPRIRVDVVDGAAVDANRREQARVLAGACEVRGDAAVLEEDGWPGIASLDRPVEVVPLIGPPDRRR